MYPAKSWVAESSPEFPLHALNILQCPVDRLHPVSHVKFAVQVVNVRLHRMRAHVERVGNVIIAVAADEKFESIDLLMGQEIRLNRKRRLRALAFSQCANNIFLESQ